MWVAVLPSAIDIWFGCEYPQTDDESVVQGEPVPKRSCKNH